MYGYHNQLLSIDLTLSQVERVPLREDWALDYLGGRGLAARYLADLLPKGADPLGPENVAILMCGPFTGTDAYACHKYEWVTKSPLTGTYLCSNTGGSVGIYLRSLGLDGVIVTGRAEKPTYLLVESSGVRLLDAADLWGATVHETQQILSTRHGLPVAVTCIGPAAEPPRSVRFASLFDGQRSAGRGGLGCVLGSKGLKAIAVARGNAEVPVHDPEGLRQLLPQIASSLHEDGTTGDALPRSGSTIWVDALALTGALPTRNYQRSIGYDEIRGLLDSETFRTRYAESKAPSDDLARATCHRCPIQSAKVCRPDRGVAKGRRVRGPEFQSVWALGLNCDVLSYPAIIAAYAACNDYGLDSVSLGGAIGFAMECCERHLLDSARIARDYNGLRLEWGSEEALLQAVEIIAERRGWLGDLLADGVRAASTQIPGSEPYALHVKGMELPGYDPRAYWSMALAYATSCRGACHLKSWTLDSEYSGAIDRASTEGKAALVVQSENRRSVIDSALVCTFTGKAVVEPWLSPLLRVVTGRDLDARDLETVGSRICDLERSVAVREGLLAEDDHLPARVILDPLTSGDFEGTSIGEANFQTMLSEYFELRGWTGPQAPSPSRIPDGGTA